MFVWCVLHRTNLGLDITLTGTIQQFSLKHQKMCETLLKLYNIVRSLWWQCFKLVSSAINTGHPLALWPVQDFEYKHWVYTLIKFTVWSSLSEYSLPLYFSELLGNINSNITIIVHLKCTSNASNGLHSIDPRSHRTVKTKLKFTTTNHKLQWYHLKYANYVN